MASHKSMQIKEHKDGVSQHQQQYGEEYDYENYVVMSRKWSRPPPPPKDRTYSPWWNIRKSYCDEEGVQYDESLVVIDKEETDSSTDTMSILQEEYNHVVVAVNQSKEKVFGKWWKGTSTSPEQNRRGDCNIPDSNYDESLLLEEEASDVEDHNVDVTTTIPPVGLQQQYKAPNLEYKDAVYREFATNDDENDIEAVFDHTTITQIQERHAIESEEYSQPNNCELDKPNPEIPTPTRRRPRVTWHNTEQIHQQSESLSQPQPNTLGRSVFFSQSANGRIQFRLPSDKIHLVMDEDLEPGTLLLLHPVDAASHRLPLLVTSPSADIMDIFHSMEYVFTVDQDLYKRVVKEISDSRLIPCGFYYCCHEAGENKVNIWVAVGILYVVLLFFLVVTLIWPY